MRQHMLVDINPTMQRILDVVMCWGGSISTDALHNNIQLRGVTKSRQEQAVRDCIERGYLRRDIDDMVPMWNHYQNPTWDEWLNGFQEPIP